MSLIGVLFRIVIGDKSLFLLFLLRLKAACLSTLSLRMQCLRGSYHPRCLASQIQARCIFRHACPVPASPTPGGNGQLELFTGDAKQLQMLFGIFENAFLEWNLRGRIDGEGQWKMLLQSPDPFHRWILLSRFLWGGLPFARFRAIRLCLLFLGPQAVA